MNAQAVKRFVEENQKLAMECTNLLTQCKKWERECSLYDHDREALMDFGNEADERAKQAEARVCELEEELKRISEDLQFYKHQCEMPMVIFLLIIPSSPCKQVISFDETKIMILQQLFRFGPGKLLFEYSLEMFLFNFLENNVVFIDL